MSRQLKDAVKAGMGCGCLDCDKARHESLIGKYTENSDLKKRIAVLEGAVRWACQRPVKVAQDCMESGRKFQEELLRRADLK